jgi:hypothetical protein
LIKPKAELLDMYVLKNQVIANSQTIKLYDAVVSSSGYIVPNGTNTTAAVLGVVVAIHGGQSGGNAPLQVNSITTTSTNTTVALVSVDILVSSAPITYIADLDAAAGTTSTSKLLGWFSMLSGTAGQLHEASYSASTPSQFYSFGVVPGSTTQVYGIWAELGRI